MRRRCRWKGKGEEEGTGGRVRGRRRVQVEE